MCNNHMTQVCVRLFVEKKERNVMGFMSDFQKLTLSDEKVSVWSVPGYESIALLKIMA